MAAKKHPDYMGEITYFSLDKQGETVYNRATINKGEITMTKRYHFRDYAGEQYPENSNYWKQICITNCCELKEMIGETEFHKFIDAQSNDAGFKTLAKESRKYINGLKKEQEKAQKIVNNFVWVNVPTLKV